MNPSKLQGNQKLQRALGQINVPGKPATFQGGYPVVNVPTTQMQDIRRRQLFDTARFKAGLAMPSDPIRLFQVAQGQQTQIANDATVTYTKRKFDCSQNGPNVIKSGYAFRILSIQAQVLTLGNLPATTGTGNNVTLDIQPGGPIGTTAPGAITQAPRLMQAILNTITLETEFVTEKLAETGLLLFFPTPYGISGAAGTGNALIDSTFVNNGFGREEELVFPRDLKSLDNVNVTLYAEVPFIATEDFQIRIIFDGIEFRPVQ
jgi:hypothetical protein